MHGTSVSFYDAPSNPNIFGDSATAARASRDRRPLRSSLATVSSTSRRTISDSATRRSHAIATSTRQPRRPPRSTCWRRPGTCSPTCACRQNDKLFVFGFSQGGHAALALHRELERMRVEVDGTAVVGAVFDVEQWLLASLAREDSIAQAAVRQLHLARLRRHLQRVRIDRRRLPPAICRDRRGGSSTCTTSSTTCARAAAAGSRSAPQAVVLCAASPRTATIRCASACGRTPWISGGRGRTRARLPQPRRRGSPL